MVPKFTGTKCSHGRGRPVLLPVFVHGLVVPSPVVALGQPATNDLKQRPSLFSPVRAAEVAPSPPREAPEAAPPAWRAPGGSHIKLQVSDPIGRWAGEKSRVRATIVGRMRDRRHEMRKRGANKNQSLDVPG